MKINKNLIAIAMLLFSLLTFSACSKAKDDYKTITEAENAKKEALNAWAKDVIDGGSFDEGIEVLTEYTNLNDFTNPIAIELSAALRKDAEAEFEKGNLKEAYELAKKIFTAMALTENIGLLDKVAMPYAKASFEAKDYPTVREVASKLLELHWNEPAMDLRMAADFELLKINIEQNNLPEAQKYYDDIMDVTGLTGNENLAKKYRDNTKKYSDKFPDSKFK